MSNNCNQSLAFDKFSKLRVGALFMQMGTGKTKVAIDLINHNVNKVDLALFVAPNQTLANLDIELAKWGLEVPKIVISYERISMSDKAYTNLLEELKGKKIFIIADESIFIKNEESKRFKRLRYIRDMCDYALILNGTPLVKNEWDLYNQMEFLSPLILDMSRNQFLNVFFKKITYKKRGEKENSFYRFSDVNANHLTKLISPYIFNCDLELDIQEDKCLFNCFVNEYTSNKYSEEKIKLIENIESKDSILGSLQKLSHINSCDTSKSKAIANYSKNKQVIIYCHFLEEVDNIANSLDNCYIITGATKEVDRPLIIEKFKNNSIPLVMTFGVGSFGLNLQFCNEIVFSSLMFDYGKVEQAQYRIKRLGQEKDIKYTYFKTNLGIENLIYHCIDKKVKLARLVKEGAIEEWIKKI